jgi:ATP-dependent RNA helicase RhlE
LVCTPGRLIDIINSYELDLSQVEYFVLDEGDRMLDMGFQDDIISIQQYCTNENLRSMIFSATVPPFIHKIAKDSMENPIMIDLVGEGSN